MDQIAQDTGWRGSPDLWLGAAFDALLEGGVDAVKILPLAKRLGLSRTSFYWFFKDREELLEALVARWREKNTGNLVRGSEAYAETIAEAMLNVSSFMELSLSVIPWMALTATVVFCWICMICEWILSVALAV